MSGAIPDVLSTPSLFLDVPLFEAQAKQIAEFCSCRQIRWWPNGVELCVLPLMECVLSLGASGFSSSKFPASGRLGAYSPECRVRFTQILPDPQPQLRTFRPEKLRHLSLICDHFAQAEQLSVIGEEVGFPLSILLEVNLGRNQTGVRPGVDARDLIRGIQTLSGVALVGVTGTPRLPELPEVTADLSSQIGLLTSLLPLLQTGDEPPQVQLVIPCGCELPEELEGVTDLCTPSLLRTNSPSAGRSPLTLRSTVISRPKLERAVLDVGRFHTGTNTLQIRSTVSGRPLPDIQSIMVDDELTTLTLGPESLDLTIGDIVEVELPDPELAWRLHSLVHGGSEQSPDFSSAISY